MAVTPVRDGQSELERRAHVTRANPDKPGRSRGQGGQLARETFPEVTSASHGCEMCTVDVGPNLPNDAVSLAQPGVCRVDHPPNLLFAASTGVLPSAKSHSL